MIRNKKLQAIKDAPLVSFLRLLPLLRLEGDNVHGNAARILHDDVEGALACPPADAVFPLCWPVSEGRL